MASWWPWQKKPKGRATADKASYGYGGMVTAVKPKPKPKPKVVAKPVVKAPVKPASKPAPPAYGVNRQLPQGKPESGQDQPPSPYPEPDFPVDLTALGGAGQDFSLGAGDIAQQTDLLARSRALGLRGLGQQTTDLRAQLANQLSGIGTKRTQITEDATRAKDEYRRRLPIQQREILNQAASRGAALSEGRQMAQDEAQRATDEALTRTDTELSRNLESLTQAETEANQTAARQEREATDARDAFNLDVEQEDWKAKVASAKDAHERAQASRSATKVALEANASKAKSFMTSRVNQLMAHQMPEKMAREKALSEARTKFTGVSNTDLEGAYQPVKETTYVPALQRYGVDISLARAAKISPKDMVTIRKHPVYRTGLAKAQEWKAAVERSGKTPTVDGMIQFAQQSWKVTHPDATPADLQQLLKKYDRYYSLYAAEIGLEG